MELHDPPAILADDALRILDEAGVARGVVFSSAYLYALPALDIEPEQLAKFVRRENEFTAAEVARYPERLTGFLSVHPLAASALDEIAFWRGSTSLIGLKLHLMSSGVDLRNERHREQVRRVLQAASDQNWPLAMHVGGGDFDAADTEILVEELLSSIGSSVVQIAHAGGGYPIVAGRQVEILNKFADYIDGDDPRTRRVLFDLAYVPAPEESAESVAALTAAMRRSGINRFVIGSDYNVQTPAEEVLMLQRLKLTGQEMLQLQENYAPLILGPDR
jgi:predicted TIM-barrel fold metal-dependent hydrolase